MDVALPSLQLPPLEGEKDLPLDRGEYIAAASMQEAYDLQDKALKYLLWCCECFFDPDVVRHFKDDPKFIRCNSSQLYKCIPRVILPSRIDPLFSPKAKLLKTCLVPKNEAIQRLHEKRIPFCKDAVGIFKADVEKIVAQLAVPSHPSQKSGEKTDEVTHGAWMAAVDEYEKKHKRRSNDALPCRMRIYLRRLHGEHFSGLKKTDKYQNKNVSQYMKKAREKDVPELRALFPELPTLPSPPSHFGKL